jgi:hypothetical protein
MHHKLCLFFAIVSLCQILSSDALANDKTFKWMKISGKWENQRSCKDSSYFLGESQGKTREWGYSELINYNSIIAENPLKEYSRITFTMEIADPTDNPVQVMAFFAARDFRYFHAFRFSGVRAGINKVSLISSREKNPKLPRRVKGNFIIEEKLTKDFALEYDKNYRIDIRFYGESVQLYIDQKRIASFVSKEPLNSGRFGFSNRNASIKIAAVKVSPSPQRLVKGEIPYLINRITESALNREIVSREAIPSLEK